MLLASGMYRSVPIPCAGCAASIKSLFRVLEDAGQTPMQMVQAIELA